MKFVFATNNQHKLIEVRKILPPSIGIVSLKEIGCFDDLPETGNTIEANALQKARYIYDKYGMNCLADDTGLEVAELGGRPGVYSARFAGSNADAMENNMKLLLEMKGIENRKAAFRTIIVLIHNNDEYFFEGRLDGTIAENLMGTNGFGYDPLFKPSGFSKTFAEMTDIEKNSMSHRYEALKKLVKFLTTDFNYS